MRKTERMLEVEGQIGESLKKYLEREYVCNFKSTRDIASNLHLSSTTVQEWLISNDIQLRTNSESRLLPRGLKKPSEKNLKRMYVTEGMSSLAISDETGVSAETVFAWLRSSNIKIRDISEARMASKGLKKPSRKELKRMYVAEGMSSNEIAKEFDASNQTILRWLNNERIQIRNTSEAVLMLQGKSRPGSDKIRDMYIVKGMSPKKISKELGFSHGSVMGWIKDLGFEIRDRYSYQGSQLRPTNEELKRMYVAEGMSSSNIAREIGTSPGNVLKWIKKAGINIRQRGERAPGQSLESFLSEHSDAKALASMAAENGYVSDVAEILYGMWPERFPSASDLARSLPGAIKRIGHSLHPFTMDKARGFYKDTFSLPKDIKYSLDGMLYTIAVDQYQKSFNDNPEKTLNELREFSKQKNGVKKLAKKVLKYYDEIYNFSLPGFGNLKDAQK